MPSDLTFPLKSSALIPAGPQETASSIKKTPKAAFKETAIQEMAIPVFQSKNNQQPGAAPLHNQPFTRPGDVVITPHSQPQLIEPQAPSDPLASVLSSSTDDEEVDELLEDAFDETFDIGTFIDFVAKDDPVLQNALMEVYELGGLECLKYIIKNGKHLCPPFFFRQ